MLSLKLFVSLSGLISLVFSTDRTRSARLSLASMTPDMCTVSPVHTGPKSEVCLQSVSKTNTVSVSQTSDTLLSKSVIPSCFLIHWTKDCLLSLGPQKYCTWDPSPPSVSRPTSGPRVMSVCLPLHVSNIMDQGPKSVTGPRTHNSLEKSVIDIFDDTSETLEVTTLSAQDIWTQSVSWIM